MKYSMMYFLFFLLGINTLPAQQVIPLWPEGRMPNSKGLNLTDLIIPGGGYREVTLLIHADNDTGVSPLNSIVFYQALKAAGISSSLHIFPFGSHRLGIENNPGSAKLWPELSVEWLKEMKFIPK